MSDKLSTPDFRHYPMSPGLESVEPGPNWLQLRWRDGAEGRFHYVWLRDNAADAASIDPHSHEKLFDILDFCGRYPAPGGERRQRRCVMA